MTSRAKLLVVLIATACAWALAAGTASAQGPTTIEATDSAGPAWQPAQVTVPAGSTVRWESASSAAPHTLTSSSDNWSIDETRNPGGDAIERSFEAPGTYTFLCRFHGGMSGSVTVTEAESRFDVLVFSRTTGFRHADAIAAGRAAIPQMGGEGDYNVELSEDATLFTDAGLRPFEVVVFLN